MSWRVPLKAGHHELEIRLATFGGHPELAVLVVPATGVDRPGKATPLDGATFPSAAADPVVVAREFAETYVANRRGERPGDREITGALVEGEAVAAAARPTSH